MFNVIKDEQALENLAANLNFLLSERGITQRRLAAATQRPLTSISNVLRGRSLPSVALVVCIAEALGYSVEELVGDPVRIAAKESLASSGKKSLVSA